MCGNINVDNVYVLFFKSNTGELKASVVVYLAANIEIFKESKDLAALLAEDGAFVQDFWLLIQGSFYVDYRNDLAGECFCRE